MSTKKVGIVADSYKVPKFIEELTKRGYTVGALYPATNNTMSITLEIEESQVQEIANLCTLLQTQFNSN